MKRKNLFLTAITILGFATFTMAQHVPDYVPKNGLLGWWPFNGNAIDETNNGNNGTVYGATLTTDRFGLQNSAYSFDGKSSKIDIPTNSQFDVQSFTFSVWVYRKGGGSGQIISKTNWTNATGESYTIHIEDSYLSLDLKKNSKCIGGTGWNRFTIDKPTSFDNQWQQVVVTYDGVSYKYYINGGFVAFGTFQGPIDVCPGGQVRFGAWWQNNANYFSGKLDDIGIWSRALDAIEVSNLYNGNICYQQVTVTDTLVIHTNITRFNPITYQNAIKIWPNPTNDHITIDNGNFSTFSDYQIKISNALGQQVFQSVINQKQFYVDMRTWGGNGIYFVNIIDKQGNTIDIRKIVLTR